MADQPTPQDVHDYADQVLADHPEIPPEYIHNLINTESSGRANAVGPRTRSGEHAIGPMQLMPGTARDLGVDPHDWRQNVEGGIRLFGQHHEEFGDPVLAAAAYHAGAGAVRKNLAAGGSGIPDTDDGLTRTSEYVNRIAPPRVLDDAGRVVPQPDGPEARPSAPSASPFGRKLKPQPWDNWPTAYAKSAEPEPEPHSNLADVGRAAMAGGAELPQIVGQGLSWAGRKTGIKPIEQAGDWTKMMSEGWPEAWKAGMSPENRTALDSPLLKDDWSVGDSPLRSLVMQTANMALPMMAMGGEGGLALKGLDAAGAVSRAARVLAAADVPAATVAKVTGNIARGTAFGGSAGLHMGLQAAASFEAGVHALPPEELDKSPAFQTAYSQTDPSLPIQRRRELATDVVAKAGGDQVFGRAFLVAGTLTAATGGGLFSKLARPEGGVVRRVAQGGAVEAGTMTPLMAGMQAVQNQAQQDFVDPNHPMSTGMAGAVASGVTMAPFGMVHGLRGPHPATETMQGNLATGAPFRSAAEAEKAQFAIGGNATHDVVQVGDNAFMLRDRAAADAAAEAAPKPGTEPTIDQAGEAQPEPPMQASAPDEARPTPSEIPIESQLGSRGAFQAGDVGRSKDNAPFASEHAANFALTRAKGGSYAETHEPVQVGDNAWVLRPKDAKTDTGKPDQAQAAPAAEAATTQPALTERAPASISDAQMASLHEAGRANIADMRQYGAGDRAPVETVDAAAQEAHPEPTPAQIEAGNAKLGHPDVGGLGVSVENPAGSIRRSKPGAEHPWENEIKGQHYGYVATVDGEKAPRGPDKEHNDISIKEGTPTDYSGPVHVIDQMNPATGKFDETKAFAGWKNATGAKNAYRSMHEKGWKGAGKITTTDVAGYKDWLKNGDTTKPFAEYRHEQAPVTVVTDRTASKTGAVQETEKTPVLTQKEAKTGGTFGKNGSEPAETKPEDKMVKVKAIEAESGRTVTMKMRAGDALKHYDEHIQRAKDFLECLST